MGRWKCTLEALEVTARFWSGKRVFVTGHTGFKGGWLCLWLQSLGAKVYGYALDAPTDPHLFGIARVEEDMAGNTIADIRDAATFMSAMQAAQPDVIFHLAAQPLVRYSYTSPVETYAVNVMGTVNLLEAVRATPGVRAVVNVTTDKCYENFERHHSPATVGLSEIQYLNEDATKRKKNRAHHRCLRPGDWGCSRRLVPQ